MQRLRVGAKTGSLAFDLGDGLGLGEGGPQFDRRGSADRMRSSQGGYRLRTHGGRVPIPWLIGTSGWAMFIHRPYGHGRRSSPIDVPARGRIKDETAASPPFRRSAGHREGGPRNPLRRRTCRRQILSVAFRKVPRTDLHRKCEWPSSTHRFLIDTLSLCLSNHRYTFCVRRGKITPGGLERRRPAADGPSAHRSSITVRCNPTEGPGHGCNCGSDRGLLTAASRSD